MTRQLLTQDTGKGRIGRLNSFEIGYKGVIGGKFVCIRFI